MIVVEGPDGAGKTKLVERLEKDLRLPVMPKVVNSEAEPLVDLKEWVNTTEYKMRRMKDTASPHIFDRHRLVSELIYGPVLRQELEEGFEDLDWLAGALLEFYSARPVLICALPPWPLILGNVVATNQPKKIQNNWKQIYWSYHCWVAQHRRAITVWDYTTGSYNDLLAEVIHRLTKDWSWDLKMKVHV